MIFTTKPFITTGSDKKVQRSLVFLLLFFAAFVSARVKPSEAVVSLGSGYITGRASSVFTFAGGLSLVLPSGFSDEIDISLSGIYARDADYFLPENRAGKYYPYVYGLRLELVFEQPVSKVISLTGSGGILLLNDRTFSDVNEWGSGLGVSGGAKLYIENTPFSLGITASYGLTLTATTPSYSLFTLNTGYNF